MVVSSLSRSASQYRPSPLATLPPQLDPNEYSSTPEKRRAEAERLAIRSRLKREYLLQLNDPGRTGSIDDPAVTRWNYARRHNIYSSYRYTPKSSLMSLLFGVGPLVFWYIVFKTDRVGKAHKEKLKEEGLFEENFRTSY